MFFQGDFGISYRYNMPVADMIANRLPNTILLGTSALFISLVVGIPLGILSALNRNKILDHATRLLVLLFASFPGFG